ncbi:hypothetical protein AB0F81_29790 [Actinoplanes sp. NPDC024001]|uniref:hypothetical protein n=1 Tax=Actinoplanes sp. NPDC024001 TaxID=3154598 RepID=UPI0033F98A4C
MAAAASFVVSLVALVVSLASLGVTLYNNRRADPLISVELSSVGLAGAGPAIQVRVINKGRAAARVDYWGITDLRSGHQISWAFFIDPSLIAAGDPDQVPGAPTVIPAHDSRPFFMPKQKLREALDAMGSPNPRIQGRVSMSTGRWHLSRNVIDL